jgi:hypothetical protein
VLVAGLRSEQESQALNPTLTWLNSLQIRSPLDRILEDETSRNQRGGKKGRNSLSMHLCMLGCGNVSFVVNSWGLDRLVVITSSSLSKVRDIIKSS